MNAGDILVIDDEEVICSLLKDTLTESGFSVTTFQDAKKGIAAARQGSFDAILVDLRISEIDGLSVLKTIKQLDTDNIVIVITGYPSFESVKEALRQGAFDYIVKPFNLDELIFTVSCAVSFRRLNHENKRLMEQIAEEKVTLEDKVRERTQDLMNLYNELQTTYLRTIKALAEAIDAKDHYTHSHSVNVARYADMIAEEMKLPAKEIEELKRACELHDIGKIGIHDYILTKPSKLTPEEWEEVRCHSLRGAEILGPLKFLDGIIDIVRQHHERYDGRGYPYGLKGEAISLGARIIALADAFDAMTSARPYRENPLTKQEVIEEIKRNSGTQFDPKVVEAFLRIVDRL